MKKTYKICTIGGDGIGPEVIDETLRLLQASGLSFEFIQAYAGYDAYKKFGSPLPKETLEKATNAEAILFGAVTTPPNIEGYFSPIVRLRKSLNLFANVRPIKSLPIKESRPNLDFTIIRENTEDLYGGHERITDDGVIAERLITKKASERILRFAFNLAKRENRKTVTVVHKANVLRKSDGLFLEIANKVAADFPEIKMVDMLVDSTAMQLIRKPEQFEIIVTTNMFGDILSDEASALIGGLGVAASANIGENAGLFEPVHGSAPKYVATGRANPTASFLAAALMLDFLKENQTTGAIRQAVNKTIENRICTPDLGGTADMKSFTDAVIANLQI